MLQKLFLEGTRETGMWRGWAESLMMTQGLLRQRLSTDILEGWKRSPNDHLCRALWGLEQPDQMQIQLWARSRRASVGKDGRR